MSNLIKAIFCVQLGIYFDKQLCTYNAFKCCLSWWKICVLNVHHRIIVWNWIKMAMKFFSFLIRSKSWQYFIFSAVSQVWVCKKFIQTLFGFAEKFYAKINQTKMIGIWYKAYHFVYYMYYDRKVWMVSALNQGPVWQSVVYLLLNSQASLDLVNNTIKNTVHRYIMSPYERIKKIHRHTK